MRYRTFFVLALILTASVAAAAEIRGAWSALVKGNRVQLNMVRDRSNWGHTMSRSEFALTEAQINSAAETPVRFSFNRDAGTIDFSGTFQSGEGVGRFSFTPSRTYLSTLQSLGVSTDSTIDDDDL